MRAGFIGLGSQGGGMAEAIQKAGHGLCVWARRPEALAPYVKNGATAAVSPAALARDVEYVGLCVVNDADVRQIVYEQGVLAAMPAGAVLAIHSTVSVETCATIAADAAKRGVVVIDAPVSGGGRAAAEGRLLVMVGGEAKDVARAEAVLKSFAKTICHVGPVGSGQIAKLVNNILFIAGLGIAEAALELGASLNLERAALRDMMLHGSGQSFALDTLDKLIVPATAAQSKSLFAKDVDLIKNIAKMRGLQMDHLAAASAEALLRLDKMAARG